MSKLTIKILSQDYVGSTVKVNGEAIRFKKSKDPNDKPITRVGEIELGSKKAVLEVSNWFELERKGWFFYAFFFWLIGVFGILSPRYEKVCHKINFKTNLELMEGKDDSLVEIKFISPFKLGYAMELNSNFTTSLSNESNRYTRSYIAERRRKVVSILGFFGTIVAMIFVANLFIV
ncbi:MAG: hypothetical protein WCR30_04150 [Clostridia bacterium]